MRFGLPITTYPTQTSYKIKQKRFLTAFFSVFVFPHNRNDNR